ncbi:MAG: transposase [Candidatus Magasanikbacteria bacterium]
MYKKQNKFFSNHIYEQYENEDNFLYQLDQLLDWPDLIDQVRELAENEEGGRPRWSPETMTKMLILAFLYDRSDREMEQMTTDNIRVKHFLGIEIHRLGPGHTSLSRFRTEIVNQLGENFIENLLVKILIQAREAGIEFGRLYAMDATDTESRINGAKDSREVKQGEREKSKDEDAAWGVKTTKTKLDKDGSEVKVPDYFFGYKVQALCETEHGLVTKNHTTPGNTADIDGGDELIDKHLTKEQIDQIDTLTADKGYASGVWINILEQDENINTAFSLPETMTDKGEHQQRWTEYMEDEDRKEDYKQRSTIERIFSDVKRNHGLNRSRYIGKAKTHLQATLTMLAHNLKRIVKVLTGVRFKPI